MRYPIWLLAALVACLARSGACQTQEFKPQLPPKHPDRLYAVSFVAVAAATVLDAHSSWGKLEGNGVLGNSQGRFATSGAAKKGAIIGAVLVAEYIAARKWPNLRKRFTWINFAGAGATAAVAAHNYQIRSHP